MWGIVILLIVFVVLLLLSISLFPLQSICSYITDKHDKNRPQDHHLYSRLVEEQDGMCKICKDVNGLWWSVPSYETVTKKEYLEIKADDELAEAEHVKRVKDWEKHKPNKFVEIISHEFDNVHIAATVLTIIFGFITLIVAVVFLNNLFSIPSEITEFTHMREMIEQVIANGSDYDNLAISQTKIEFNSWLADAIASLERWGNWSAYYPWADEIYSLSYLI